MLIKNLGATEKYSEFIEQNINNIEEFNDEQKLNINNKKAEIFMIIENVRIITKLETKNYNIFMTEFRKKYGITEEDINTTELIKTIAKHNFGELNILIEILKKLNYLTKYD